MHLKSVKLENFKGFKKVDFEFHPSFNIIVGINGTGKSSLLEAIKIAIGSIFLNLDKVEDKIVSPMIHSDYVRIDNLEKQFPSVITTSAKFEIELLSKNISKQVGLLNDNIIAWTRSLEKLGGRTTKINAKDISDVSYVLQKIIRESSATSIPIVAYYSTDRFKKEKKDVGLTVKGSRLRGYYNSLDQLTNIKFFLDLIKTETLSSLQLSIESTQLKILKKVVLQCIEDANDIYFDISENKLIIILGDDNQKMPFEYLSDGIRSSLALVMELAIRCYLLNPHLGEEAPAKTYGVILIDELDLHLHPKWQKNIILDLRNSFPCLQFIVTTHAPLVIGSLNDGRIYEVSNNQIYDFPPQYGSDVNTILGNMEVEPMIDNLREKLDRYFLLLETDEASNDEAIRLRSELETTLGDDHSELQRADLILSFFS